MSSAIQRLLSKRVDTEGMSVKISFPLSGAKTGKVTGIDPARIKAASGGGRLSTVALARAVQALAPEAAVVSVTESVKDLVVNDKPISTGDINYGRYRVRDVGRCLEEELCELLGTDCPPPPSTREEERKEAERKAAEEAKKAAEEKAAEEAKKAEAEEAKRKAAEDAERVKNGRRGAAAPAK